MSIVEPNIEEEGTQYRNFRVLRGGKGPPEFTGGGEDWLSKLEKNAVFTCLQKGQSEKYVLSLLIVLFKHTKTVVIGDALNGSSRMAVDPVEFCKKHTFFELIEEGGELPEGEEDGNSSRSVRSGGVGDDVDAEGRQPSDGGS